LMAVARFDPEGTVTVMGAWNRTSSALAVRVGGRVELGGRNATTQVFETGRPARVEHTTDATGPIARVGQEWGSRSSVAVPVSVEGRLWGVMNLTSQSTPLPADAEARLAGFTELVAMAIANAQARIELRTFAEEQASLRRVATLVARGAQPDELFVAVTEEVGRVLASDYAALSRYEPDGTVTVMGAWNGTGSDLVVPVGGRVDLGGRNAATQVFETGRPARIDHTNATGAPADLARSFGSRSTVGVPINVEGRLWGVMNVFSTHQEPLPADTEARLAGFADLIATAVANADAQAAFAQSQDRHRRAESQFKDFFELSPDLLCIVGDDGYFKRVNPAFEQTLGYSSEELLSVPFLEFVHTDDRARTGETLVLAGRREIVQFENRFIRKDGSECWLQWNSRPASDESLLVYAAARDITVSRRAREQQAALRRVATLVARGVAPTEVFDAVTAELRDLMSADLTGLLRYEADRTATLLAVHAGPGLRRLRRRVSRSMVRVLRHWCCALADRRGWEVLLVHLLRSARSASTRESARRSSSRAECGARSSPRGGMSMSRRIPRVGWRSSETSWRRQLPTPTPAPSLPRPAPGCWWPPTMPGVASSAICTTASNSGLLPSGFS